MEIIGPSPASIDLDEFLTRPLFAHLATVVADGPRDSPVWYLWEEQRLWIIGNRGYNTFPAHIEKNPRCAISVVDFDPVRGMVHHVGLRGGANVVPWDTARAKRLLRRYLGEQEELWDAARFVDSLDDPQNVFVCLTPVTAVIRDQSYRPSL